VAACERIEEGALRNFRSLRTTAAGAFGEQDEVEDGMLGREGGSGSSAGVYKGLELRCIGLAKMAAEVDFLEPRWLFAALARLRIPCTTPLPTPVFVGLLPLCPSCFPLSLPYLGLGLGQLDGVALGMSEGTHSDGRAVDSQGSGCGGEG